MGAGPSKTLAKASKAASLSASNTARKYPTRSPPPSSPRTNVEPNRPSPTAKLGPTVHPETSTSSIRDQSINLDASDPDIGLNSRLRELGPVQPSPTQSNSSTFNQTSAQDASTPGANFIPSASAPLQSIYPTATNPAISLLAARYRIAEEAEKDFETIGRKGSEGRKYLDVATIRTVLVYRAEGMPDAEIERRLEIKSGMVKSLGGRVVSVTGL
ncbi:hypothetical protein SBOR_10141 [Sclerotinia borealis F-4128]|uniref:Helix-turn-helix domain-containing protein n=1 Tax=Sclerotinia borealis (strain F-4128) TaxID=1432307 RepID=W9C3H2_SCLBF|nr:hypothetical protein SBOR_10141 [Sclerotinia borealis F-4128]